MKDDRVYLRHIVDAIETIESYIVGQTFEGFLANKRNKTVTGMQLKN